MQDVLQAAETHTARRPVSLAAVFACVLAVAIVLRAFTFTTAGLDWDESLYVVIAQRWLHGGIPYVAVWDQHPMGLPALFALAQALIGDGLLAARIVALLAVSGTTVLLYAILARQGERVAGALAASLYLLYMTRPDGLAANTEVINNLFVTAAATLLMSEFVPIARALRIGRMFAAALLLGMGLQIKYVVLPEAVFLCCLALMLAWHAGASYGRLALLAGVAMLGGLVPTAAATLYFWHAGALQPYLDANLVANAAYLDLPLDWGTALMRLRFGLLPIFTLLPWPFVLAFLLRRSADRTLHAMAPWLLAWLIAAVIDVVLPLKFWKHYFNALLPPLSLMMGLSAVLLARRFARWQTATIAAIAAAVAIPAVLLVVKHAADSRSIDRLNVPLAVAERIQQGGDADDTYVLNYDPLVYSYLDAVPPTRFVLGIELADFDTSSGAKPMREMARILRRKPAWIVVARPSPYAFSPDVRDLIHATLREHYQLDSEWTEEDYIQPPIEVQLFHRRANEASSASTR